MHPSLRLAVAVSAVFLAAAPAQEAGKKRVTVAQAYRLGGPEIRWFSSPPRASWAADGVHIEIREGKKIAWIDPATMERKDPPGGAVDNAAAAGPRTRGRGGRDGRRGRRVGSRPDREGRRIVLTSPDGKHQSYVFDHNLVIASKDGKEQWQVTSDGSEELLYGILDWVYQEEVYGRGNFQGQWWSPNSDFVVFLRIDEEPVKEFTVVDHVPDGFLDKERAVVSKVTKYPKAGDPNPTVRVGIAKVAARRVHWVDLSGFPDDLLVVRVSFTPDGERAVLQIQDRIQTWMELVYADPANGKVTKVLREEANTWVNRLPPPRWLEDGTFLWMTERTGYQHVEHYRPGGQKIRAITAGEWQVRRIEHLDQEQGLLWFEGSEDGAIDRNWYRVALDGTGKVRLTRGPGQHQVSWRSDRKFFIDTVSAIEDPAQVRLCRGETGEVLAVLGKAEPAAALEYDYSPKKQLVIEARDGYPLDATVVLPTRPTASARYPIFLSTYSGPDAPTVRNRFRVSSLEQFLAQRGVITLNCNVRSASGRGQAHTGLCYRRLGVQELRDLEDAVQLVVKQFSGDPSRVAIDGWSYGGFMAAYALTHSKSFTLGFAGAGVHDWRLYDTIYTERYMSTPQLNPEGYNETSVIKGAGGLHGHLVILHGTMDDNVHLQNSMQLVYALQAAGKDDFEIMFYPKSRHGVRGALRPHLQRLKWRVLQREWGLEQ